MNVDRRSPLPLWAQVLGDLRTRLAQGEFTTRFPSDVELVRQYSVSRHTAREAVRRLQAEGVLERERGRGSFLKSRRIEQPVGSLYSLFRSVEDHGLEQRSKVRFLEERRDREAAAALGRPAEEPLVYLERLRFAGEEPIALDCSWLPAFIGAPLLDVDFGHTALYKQLVERCGVTLTSAWERINPTLPSREQRELLDIGTRQPAFAIERLTYQVAEPVEWRHSVVRGDRFSFVARWSNHQVNTSFEPTSASVPTGA